MGVVRAALGLLLLWASGWATATLLCPGVPRALRWGWALGLGSGWVPPGLAASALVGMAPALGFAVPVAPLTLWAWRALRAGTGGHADAGGRPRVDRADALAGALLVAVLVPALALAL